MNIAKEENRMRTRIISAFPGTGKSYYHKKNPETTLDSDSSQFSWIIENGKKVRNPEFPGVYIEHIKENIGKYEFIFVSTHIDVRNSLRLNCLHFYLFFPREIAYESFIKRYIDRGNEEDFVKLLKENYFKWIGELSLYIYGCKNKPMIFKFLEDELNHLVSVEDNGF